jgi:hypothetical protein
MSVVSVFSRQLVLNLFPFPLTPAQLLSDGLLIKGCAANCWQHFTFLNIFLFAAPLFSRFTHLEGVGEEPNHMA